MNIDELCIEVNRILKTRRITVANARTASTVTPRNVRYYRTIGLIEPPMRSEGRAIYEQDHIDQIVAIKEAQQDGVSLEELLENRKRIDFPKSLNSPIFSMNRVDTFDSPRGFLASRSIAPQINDRPTDSKATLGWSVHFQSAVLSGRGTPPTQLQIDAIRKTLEEIDTEEE